MHPPPRILVSFSDLETINENDKKFKNSNPLRFMYVTQPTIREINKFGYRL
jgi:hypothetical protein